MVNSSMDVQSWLRQQLALAQPDMLRSLLQTMVEGLMSAEVNVLCNAEYGERTADRENARNGYRQRDWDTRLGSISLGIPKLRQGSYFPDWLLQPRRRVERAMVAVIAEAPTWPGCRPAGWTVWSRPWASRGSPSPRSRRWPRPWTSRSTPSETGLRYAGPYTYVWIDALYHRCRENGRIVSVATAIATGVNASGQREILEVDVFTAEDGAAWTSFLRGLVARGLCGVWSR